MEILIGLGILLVIGLVAFAVHRSNKLLAKPVEVAEVETPEPSNIGYSHKFEEAHYPIIRDERNMIRATTLHDHRHTVRHRLTRDEVDGGDIGGAVEDLAFAGILLVDAMQNGQEMDSPVNVTPEPSYEAPSHHYEAPAYEAPSHSWGESSSSSSSSWGESSSSSSYSDSSSSSCDCGGGGGD